MPSVAGDASWVVRLLLQKNATFNQEFRETIEPMRGVHHSTHGSTTTTRHTSHCATSSSWRQACSTTLGGKLALSRSTWDAHQFPSRVHDEDGRITLLLLQAQIEERPDLDVATIVREFRRIAIRTPANRWSTTRGRDDRVRLPAHRLPSTGAGRPVCRRPRRPGAVMRGRARQQPVQCARFGLACALLSNDGEHSRGNTGAPVAELVDATDLKSVGRKAMPVRFRPGAPTPMLDHMLTVSGRAPVARRSSCAARRELRRQSRPMRAAHRARTAPARPR